MVRIKGKYIDDKGNETERFFDVGFKFNNNHAIESIGFIKGVNTTSSLTYAMLYTGYKAWCFVKQVDENVTMEDLIDWCEDEKNTEAVTEITKELENSTLFKKVNEMIETFKKKLSPDELKVA